MPFYDYQCPNNHRFELKQSYSAEPVATCPTCFEPARRLISLVPVHFKGSGFYVNDYGKKEPPSSGEGKEESKTVETAGKSGETSKEEVAKGDAPKAEPSPKDKASPSKDKGSVSQDKGSPADGKGSSAKDKNATSTASTKA